MLDSKLDPFPIKNIIETSSKISMQSEDYLIVMYQFSDFYGCISFIKKNFLVYKKIILKYSRVMGHDIRKLHSNNSGKI